MPEIAPDLQATPAVARVYAAGYCIWYSREEGTPYYHLTARRDGASAASGFVEVLPQQGQIRMVNVWTSENHRRQGLANSLYVAAEGLVGCMAIRSGLEDEGGRLLWDQPDRPFGNPGASHLLLRIPPPPWPE